MQGSRRELRASHGIVQVVRCTPIFVAAVPVTCGDARDSGVLSSEISHSKRPTSNGRQAQKGVAAASVRRRGAGRPRILPHTHSASVTYCQFQIQTMLAYQQWVETIGRPCLSILFSLFFQCSGFSYETQHFFHINFAEISTRDVTPSVPLHMYQLDHVVVNLWFEWPMDQITRPFACSSPIYYHVIVVRCVCWLILVKVVCTYCVVLFSCGGNNKQCNSFFFFGGEPCLSKYKCWW